MSNTERESLVFRITEELATYVVQMERRLDNLSEQFNNRPELQQLTELKNTFAQMDRKLSEPSAPPKTPSETVNLRPMSFSCVDEIQQQPISVQAEKYQLVFERSGSRAVLMEALTQVQERLIIVCPWLNRNSIDANLMQKLRDCLNRNCHIDIGWGHLSDRSRLGKGWRYDALKDLRQLERDYPNQFRLKLLGTHEKFLVCDSTFAMLGSHNMLTSSVQSAERELGIRTTDANIIQGLINRFDGASVQDVQIIDESLAASYVDTETLDIPDLGDESDTTLVNSGDREAEEDIDDLAEDEQGTSVNAEEFLRRYNNKERDFTGINLAKVDLTGKILRSNDLNLSSANLSRANLTKTDLYFVNLSGANLRGAELYGAELTYTNLSEANLENADLSNVNLSGANLEKANLRKAILTGVKLFVDPNFNGANLSGANLSGITMTRPQLTKADLSHANLINASLSGANLTKATLVRARLIQADLSGSILSKTNLSEAALLNT